MILHQRSKNNKLIVFDSILDQPQNLLLMKICQNVPSDETVSCKIKFLFFPPTNFDKL